MAVYGYVTLDSYMVGTDVGSAISTAFAALGAAGGTIDARNVNLSGFSFKTQVTVNKPLTLLLGPGNYAAGGGTPPAVLFLVSAASGAVGNFCIRGMDPYSSSITAAAGGTIFKFTGDFFNYAGDGKPFFQLKNLTLDGASGASCMLDAGTVTSPTLNFQDGLILVEDCNIINFGSTKGAIWLGPSVYFSRIHRNEFHANYGALYLDNNTESSITENYFSQSATSGPTITSIGPMHRIVNNYFYRSTIAATSNAPDILLQPTGAPSQAGGFVWILDNRFGGERENFDVGRYRIRLYSSSTSTIAGPAIVKGNQFLGPSSLVAKVASSGGTATVTLPTTNSSAPTQGLVAGTSVVTLSGITPAQFNGTFTLTGSVTSTTFQFALAGTVGLTVSSGLVTLSNGSAISLENPSLAWDISGNFFAQYGILINDAQTSLGAGFGGSMFLDNRVAPLDTGYRIFRNEGREFGTTRHVDDSALVPWNGDARTIETRKLRNRLPASEALDTWATNWTGTGSMVVGGATDPTEPHAHSLRPSAVPRSSKTSARSSTLPIWRSTTVSS